eukprot:CAMPEP_0117683196 /NCGR_PEP_ID=MMETSP0804-20121206/20222_1 /TAXON_ID=1074897 /ORGANISM="Tetraselmis astigmatica, Strain CCMP880" /LENGTH=160 /DNA_ID=CAMNT_0005493675 /DNA_START=282 /DNA_END=761 /DNA_ORIENTATION=-
MTVKLTEEALKPKPRGTPLGKDGGRAPTTQWSEYVLPEDSKDQKLDQMLTSLGDSLTRRSVSLYDHQALKAAKVRHAEQRKAVAGRMEPRMLAEAFQQYYQEREAKGDAAIAEIAARHSVDPELLGRVFRKTCLPAVRNESAADTPATSGGPHVQMHAQW